MQPSAEKIRVLIIDDHAGMRDGLRALLGMQPDLEVVGEAADGGQAVRRFTQLRPDISIVDFNLPVLCGVEVIRQVRADFPDARFLVITAAHDQECIQAALRAGARAFLHKDLLRRELVAAVRVVHQGGFYFPAADKPR